MTKPYRGSPLIEPKCPPPRTEVAQHSLEAVALLSAFNEALGPQ